MELRPYQIEAKEKILESWKSFDRSLLVLPTGCGKTIVFCKIIEELVATGKRCLVLAHRAELLDQAADKLRQATGLNCAVEKADQTAADSWFRTTVGSVQTLMREDRLAKFSPDFYDVIVVDEAHHALAESYQSILAYFEAKVLGVTATPDRGDMRNLGEFFDDLAYEYTLPQAIADGYLCKIKAVTIPLKIDLTGVKSTAGDFQAKSLGNALDPYLEQIAEEMSSYCRDRKTVVFLPLIATSEKMKELLILKGFKVAEVNGQSRDRKKILSDFEQGKYDIICNSMLLTEGWDCPSVDCIVPLRATKIRSLYAQIIGRGTRLFPGKENMLILDFLWHSTRHELCRPAHLICETQEVANAMIHAAEESAGEEFDLQEAVESAAVDAIAERELALAKKLAEQKNKKRKLVDPLQFEMSINSEDLAGYEPTFGWEMQPATESQKSILEKNGIFSQSIDSFGKAEKIIDRLLSRQEQGLTTPKQIRCLERYGFHKVGQWSFEDARKLIDRIAACRWRLPAGLDPAHFSPENGLHNGSSRDS